MGAVPPRGLSARLPRPRVLAPSEDRGCGRVPAVGRYVLTAGVLAIVVAPVADAWALLVEVLR